MLSRTVARMLAASALLGRGVVVPFQADPSVSANISFVLETANQTIQTNSSHDAAATFPIGIGDPRLSTVYSNWPVRPLFGALLMVGRVLFRSGNEH